MVQTVSLNGSDWLFKSYIGEDWLWRNGHKAETRDVRGWYPAQVPGSVHHDLWQAGLIPDPYFEMNSLAIEWVPERTWLYKKRFSVDPSLRGKRIELVFQGIDYSARFYLNGEELGQQTGTYLPAAFPVGEKLRYGEENLLTVVLDPAPFEQPQIGYTSKVYTQKSRMAYWWDFCPRMIHQGIWQDVYLRITGPARIEDVHVRPELSPDLRRAEVAVSVELDRADSAPLDGDVLLRKWGEDTVLQRAVLDLTADPSQSQASFTIDEPELWWPNGAGAQPLYEVEVTLRTGDEVSDVRRVRFGIRRVEFVQNEGAAEGSLPYNLMVNGQKLYIQGWNWVPADVMYGTVTPEKYEHLLQLARSAHVNLLRVWGGGLIEREIFYDLCDRLGILVWQEFIQSSSGIDNYPSEDPQFIRFLLENAETAIRARRNHASLAVWCGGNELHYAQDRLCDERHPALAALRDIVQRLDSGRHWVATSPAGGVFGFKAVEPGEDASQMQDVHGPWEYQGLRKHYSLYNLGKSLLHSEFGVEGLTNLRTLNQTISKERQWPVSLDNPVWDHLGAWWVKETVWADAFGPLPDLETTQRATQFLQADGLRYALEADRRRAFHNGGTLPWQFNEPYPMASCTSAVDYYGEPKPVYYAVARAYASRALTASFDTLAWGVEDNFTAQVWYAGQPADPQGEVVAQVLGLDGQVMHEELSRAQGAPGQANPVMTVQLPLAQISSPLFFLDLSVRDDQQGKILARNRYLFSTAEDLAPMLNLPPASMTARVDKDADRWQIDLHNASDHAALWVWLEAEKPDLRTPGSASFADNYFCLLPGEQYRIGVDWSGIAESERVVRVSGWNFSSTLVR